MDDDMRTEEETGVTSRRVRNMSNQQMLGEEPGTDFLQEPSERRAWPADAVTSDSCLQSSVCCEPRVGAAL